MEEQKFNPPPSVHIAILLFIAVVLGIAIAVPWNAMLGLPPY